MFTKNKKSVLRSIIVLSCLSHILNSQTYTLTTAGATGRFGPNQTQINTAYGSTSLNGLVTTTSGIQYWAVPASGVYRIEAYGAKGGNGQTTTGGSGAKMQGEFTLTMGQILKILVGQVGS